MKLPQFKIKHLLFILVLGISSILFNTDQTNAYTVQSFPIEAPSTLGCAITDGEDGNIWFIKTSERKLVKSNNQGTMTEFDIPAIGQLDPDPYPGFCSMAADGAGGVLFTSNDRPSPQTARSGYIRRADTNGEINSTLITIPETTINSGLAPSRMGLFRIENIDNDNYWVVGGSLEDAYNIVMKVNSSGQVLTFWETEIGEGSILNSVKDESNNLWIAPLGKLVKLNTDGQASVFPLDNIVNVTALESDQLNNIWIYPYPFDEDNGNLGAGNKLGKLNVNTNTITYYPLPEGRSTVPFSGMSRGPDGNIWFGTMNTNFTNENPIVDLSLSSMSLEGLFSQTQVTGINEIPLSLTLDKSNILWAIVGTIENGDIKQDSLRLIKISLDGTSIKNPETPPKAPKSGNPAIFIVIASLTIGSSLLFSAHIYRKHIKNVSATK